MSYRYFIIFRSLTYVQRAKTCLERAGVSGAVTRVSATVTGTGCGYAIRVAPKSLQAALDALKRCGITPIRACTMFENGTCGEIEL